MSMIYSAVLVVGLHRDDIKTDDEDTLEALDWVPPYYDGGEDAILGVVVERSGGYSAKEITMDQSKVDAAKVKFREMTGQEGKLYLTPRGD